MVAQLKSKANAIIIFYANDYHYFINNSFNQQLTSIKLFSRNKSLQHPVKWPSMKWSDSANPFDIRGCIEPAYICSGRPVAQQA